MYKKWVNIFLNLMDEGLRCFEIYFLNIYTEVIRNKNGWKIIVEWYKMYK